LAHKAQQGPLAAPVRADCPAKLALLVQLARKAHPA